jgi:hypothetical protein
MVSVQFFRFVPATSRNKPSSVLRSLRDYLRGIRFLQAEALASARHTRPTLTAEVIIQRGQDGSHRPSPGQGISGNRDLS